jgi:hypothetical protein
MMNYVYPALGIDLARVRQATGIEATFNVCRFDDKTVVAMPHTELDIDRLVAGASLPIFMPAVRAAGGTWTDAVWIRDCNLTACVERGARELWLIWCIGNTPRYHDGLFNQYVHMIEMSAVGALNSQLGAIAAMNTRIVAGETVHGHRQPITVYVVKPEIPLPLDPDFYLGRIDAATLIDMGYRDARRALRQREPAPLGPRATQMREPGVGVSFRETMAGGFSLGPTDPAIGARGAAQLTLHATIHIPDVAAFVASPVHEADLTGHIDYSPFGTAIPAESGVFGLFTPSEDPALTYMIYELGFCHGGRDYYLAGKKHVHVGPPWRLWGETTTLYCTLHEGTDATGRVVGSGILHLGAAELTKLLGSLNATNAATTGDAARAIYRFFNFFVAQLTRTYLLQRPLAAGVR